MQITERHVQAIWYDAAFRPKGLTTSDGVEIAVVSPGEWNREAGPDFRRAVLEVGLGRRRVVGDVEVHLCPSDWDLHGHGTDPNYRNVIAHVTWSDGEAPSSLPQGALSIWLGKVMGRDPGFSLDRIDVSSYPYDCLGQENRPCERKIGHDPKLARQVLADAGRRRLTLKARRLSGRLCAASGRKSQVFYEEVMTALGYKRNEVQFRHVAERVPIDSLPSDTMSARTALLVAGGFEEWSRGATRPGNTPERRLGAAADVFTQTPILRLAEESDFSRNACRSMVSMMCGERFLGRGRAATILANVVVPFALAECRVAEVPDWLPPEDISEPVRLTAYRLFGRDHNPAAFYSTNGLLIQGLIHIHHERCQRIHPDCEKCDLS